MATPKYEVEKFNGTNDFNLWKMKVKALLVSQRLGSALEETAAPSSDEEKTPKSSRAEAKRRGIQKRAHSTIVLSLSDEVLREVAGETTAIGLWKKLDSFYMRKSLANRLHIKKKLYQLSM